MRAQCKDSPLVTTPLLGSLSDGEGQRWTNWEMDKLGGTCIVLLLHHADMGVNSKAFHTSLTGHTSERHQWAWGEIGGDHSVVGTHVRR